MSVRFEEDKIVIEPFFRLLFGRKIKIPYEKIERIELPPGGHVLFYMKNGRVKKINDPAVVSCYAGFGEMLKKYKIPYKTLMEDSGDASIETVREKTARVKEAALAYGNRSLKEKLGPEYELDVRLVEHIVGTTLEFRLLKDGVIREECNREISMDDEPLADEMYLAFLSEWDPVYEQGKYSFAEEADDKEVCEKYVEDVVIDIVDTYKK